MKAVIIGGIAGGAAAAARLGKLMPEAHTILFERGPFISPAT